MKRRNTITAILFLLLTAAGLVLVATSFLGGEGKLETLLKTTVRDRDPSALLEGAESAVNSDLDRDHLFIQLYGGVQRLSGRRVIQDMVAGNTVAKLSTGALNFVNLGAAAQPDQAAVDARAEATAEFAGELEAHGVPYLYIAAPQKIKRGGDMLPDGLEENGNATCDAYLEALDKQGVDYIDLRPLFESNGIYSNWFFNTDHHWKPEAAFFAWQNLTGELDLRYGFETPSALTDPNNWNTRVLEDFFLGSQGKRVGTLYAGADDFTIYTPKFDTDLTYANSDGSFTRSGPFDQSVCFPERVAERDWFNGNPYTYYSGGDYAMATMTNHKNPNGPKVVLIRESFSCALAPFLALSCSELTTIDLRYFTGDLMDTIQEVDPDLVLTLYTASTAGLDNMFEFDKTE
ncbi:DHHW family protein [Intestinimonas massiliensis (ex Afouda et al. 2020)]|uniref:DHHW family protein n=1 Tax=Intestinimonas massiliensis (ex Afouda et al. 2020) TaxID=1673721 RepID=UPI00102F816E|nr:DHHW family protein [Intestinimonas massiliensis (ex Afouda et al. 2020)]